MVVVWLSLVRKVDRYGLPSTDDAFSAGSKGTLRPSIREKNVEVLRLRLAMFCNTLRVGVGVRPTNVLSIDGHMIDQIFLPLDTTLLLMESTPCVM